MKITLLLALLLGTTGLVAAEKSKSRGDYIAHEWGTFTSVQGSTGTQIEWNPFVVEDLPKFVHRTFNPPGRKPVATLTGAQIAGKAASNFVSRQRMETPVIYFYSDAPRTVDVGVTFPSGRITEWYPQLSEYRPAAMRWSGIELRPAADDAHVFPEDGGGSHYYSARATEAAALRVKAPDGTLQQEKFLFYRGVGDFLAPLQIGQMGAGGEIFFLSVSDKVKLAHAFLYSVRGERAWMKSLGALAGGQPTRTVELKFDAAARPLAEVRAELAALLRTALVAEGLYEKEAAAMVKTWDDSWLGEQGTRVLYTLPQAWTDKILPLTLTPTPEELKRVFVGRAELFTQAQEWALLREIVHFAEGDDEAKAAAVHSASQLGLGRFTDAVVRLLTARGPAVPEFSNAAFGLLDGTRPAPRTLSLTR